VFSTVSNGFRAAFHPPVKALELVPGCPACRDLGKTVRSRRKREQKPLNLVQALFGQRPETGSGECRLQKLRDHCHSGIAGRPEQPGATVTFVVMDAWHEIAQTILDAGAVYVLI
jgi:hypothetical protein